MPMKTILTAILLTGICFSSNAHAIIRTDGEAPFTISVTKEFTPSEWAKKPTYLQRVAGKLSFGLKNLLLGWTDLFKEPAQAVREETNLIAGTLTGVKEAIQNTVGGALHIISFPVTAIDPTLPDGGIRREAPSAPEESSQ